MITIQFIGASHPERLTHSALDEKWLATPVGAAHVAGLGPSDATCLCCAHLDIIAAKWSDCGKAAPCLEARRLRQGKPCPPVPVNTPACIHFAPRTSLVADLSAADQALDQRLEEKRARAREAKAVSDRLRDEVRELELMREAVSPAPVST